MESFEENEPPYIEESEDILFLRKHYPPNSLDMQKGHWNMAFTLLVQTLYITYGHTLFSEFVEKADIYEESSKFSKNMKVVIQTNEWSKSSASTAFNSLKKILLKTNINQSFINRIIIPNEKSIKKNSAEFCLPKQYKQLSPENMDKKVLLKIIHKVKTQTRYKAQSTIKIVIAFIIKLLKQLEISIQNYTDIINIDFETLICAIKNTSPKMCLKTKVNYTKAFICFVLEDITYLEKFDAYKKGVNTIKKIQDDNSDKHRISKEELELMYESSLSNPRNHCIFLLMISTGIRACGVSNIKLSNVCTITNNIVVVNKSCRTIEKGNKWFTLPISEKCSIALKNYILNHRKGITSYLFPGRGEDIGISPVRINAIIKDIALKAGLKGSHIHAHSLRHSFAHILLETGNSPDLVSKMLGHNSVLTTEKYYLKENAVEASKRCNIPWLERKENIDPIPNFMKKDKPKEEVKKRKTRKERNLILKNLAKDLVLL